MPLIDLEVYLTTGSHIGTKIKSGDMKKHIFKVRADGLAVLDVNEIDKRIEMASNIISQYEPNKVVVVTEKMYGFKAADLFSKLLGTKTIKGRFVPGTFTNIEGKDFMEPELVVVIDPRVDKQAIIEAKKIKAFVLALASTDNSLRNIDFVIPINNKGRKSIALVFYLLTREVLKKKGIIKQDKDFKYSVEDFEYDLTDEDQQKLKRLTAIKRVSRKKGKKRKK